MRFTRQPPNCRCHQAPFKQGRAYLNILYILQLYYTISGWAGAGVSSPLSTVVDLLVLRWRCLVVLVSRHHVSLYQQKWDCKHQLSRGPSGSPAVSTSSSSSSSSGFNQLWRATPPAHCSSYGQRKYGKTNSSVPERTCTQSKSIWGSLPSMKQHSVGTQRLSCCCSAREPQLVLLIRTAPPPCTWLLQGALKQLCRLCWTLKQR